MGVFSSCCFDSSVESILISGSSCNKSWHKIVSVDCVEDEVPVKITFVNTPHETLILCWVDCRSNNGKLHHFVPVHPKGSIRDGSVSNCSSHYSTSGHAFVAFTRVEMNPESLHDIPTTAFKAIYRAATSVANEHHVITIAEDGGAHLDVKTKSQDDAVIDNSSKEYELVDVAGFQCYFDIEAFQDSDSRSTLERDFKEVQRLLPGKAFEALKRTPFYVNSTLVYGNRGSPMAGAHATYHPTGSARWLQEHGLSLDHEGSIEIMNLGNYNKDRTCWGPGGLLLHELCHAYHDKHMQDGYDNHEIRSMYDAAIKLCLYDNVSCRFRDGTYSSPQRGYCITDPMEFFAELSVAYLWKGGGDGGHINGNEEEKECEFNKWSPHNRAQLREHDRSTHDGLCVIWEGGESRD
jgi:hypothetical protein